MHTSRLTEGPAPKKTHAFGLIFAPFLVLFIIVAVGQLLSTRYRFLSPTVAALVIVGVIAIEVYTYYEERSARHKRALLATTIFIVAITLIEINGVAKLIWLLLSKAPGLGGETLLASGVYYWGGNVLVFGLWYWLFDRGGPLKRFNNEPAPAELYFPEMEASDYAPEGWRPRLFEYMFLSFTSSTAFSPTDTLPLSSRIRLLMALESILSLMIVALVTARAINILS